MKDGCCQGNGQCGIGLKYLCTGYCQEKGQEIENTVRHHVKQLECVAVHLDQVSCL